MIKLDYVILIQIVLLCILKHDFYKDINSDVDKWFDTSNYDKNDNRPLEIGKKKKVLGKFKDELSGKIMNKKKMNKIVNKKAKGTKKMCC